MTMQNNICIAETNLYITTGFTSPVSDFYASVLAEAGKRLKNITINFEALPAERSLALANQGINDGDCCRIPDIMTSEYTNLEPINESFFSARFSAFTKNNNTQIKNFKDLKPYSVGTVTGWKIAVIKLKEIKPEKLHIVATPQQMLKMLEQDRLDYGVVGYLSGLHTIASLELNNIKAIEPPLVKKQLYLLLHNKHKNLIPVFENVFKKMKDDGTIDRLYKNLIKSLKH